MAKNKFAAKPRPDYVPPRLRDDPPLPDKLPPLPKKRTEKVRGWIWRSGLVRVGTTLLISGLFLHGLFTVFGIYDGNRTLEPAARAALWLKLAVFLAVVVVVYQVVIRFGPMTKRLRGASAMALMPGILMAVFALFGGKDLFGDNMGLVVALNIVIGLGGFMGYLLVYAWCLGMKKGPGDPGAEHKARRARDMAPPCLPEIGAANRRKPPPVRLPD